jgi:hypothetical protein
MHSLALRVLVAAMFSAVSASDELSVARAQVSAASTYYVSLDGSDAAAGTEAAPFRTIQRAASLVDAGDTAVVRAGTYAGFQLGWDFPQSGTATQPSPSKPTREPSSKVATAKPLTASTSKGPATSSLTASQWITRAGEAGNLAVSTDLTFKTAR